MARPTATILPSDWRTRSRTSEYVAPGGPPEAIPSPLKDLSRLPAAVYRTTPNVERELDTSSRPPATTFPSGCATTAKAAPAGPALSSRRHSSGSATAGASPARAARRLHAVLRTDGKEQSIESLLSGGF